MKILYVDNIENLDYNYLPIYKKCDNGKYLQLCSSQLSDELFKEKADITDLVKAIDGFSQQTFNELSKKLNVKFVEDEEEKKLVNTIFYLCTQEDQ